MYVEQPQVSAVLCTDTPKPSVTQKENHMAETTNFYDNPMAGNAGWGAGIGGLIGAAVGNGGLFGGGNRQPAVTPDQLQASLNSLQGTMNTDQIQAQLNGIQGQISETGTAATVALGAGIAGVKDAVVHSDHHSQMALCNLGHAVQSGFASVNQNILAQSAQSRELALQQALDAERARATELRIALSEHKNQAGHQATQVLLNQVISAKGE